MRFDIYKGKELAATFVYGTKPRYFGACGDELAALFNTTPIVYNFWTREFAPAPAEERADWWASKIISAPLARAGFELRPVHHQVGWDFEWIAESAMPSTSVLPEVGLGPTDNPCSVDAARCD